MGPVARGIGFAAALILLASPLAAQVRPPADTIRPAPDTARVSIPPGELPADTFVAPPPDTVPADSLVPAPRLPEIPPPPGRGWGAGVWVFDREALRGFHGLTLLELLERIPGLVGVRAGGPGFPVGLSAFGTGGGRLRVFLDGWELDPTTEAAFDVQRFALADLDGVRVERGLVETRVYLDPYVLPTRESRSRIEAGTGDFDTRLLRGLFAAPLGERYTLSVAADITDTDGARGREPFTSNHVIGRLVRTFGSGSAVAVEYRDSRFDRGGALFPQARDRRELFFRGRTRLSPVLLLDAAAGRVEEEARDSAALGGTTRYQAFARAVWGDSLRQGEVGARLRTGGRDAILLPELELFGRAGLRIAPGLLVGGRLRASRLDGATAGEAEGWARAELGGGLAAFVQGAAGERGVGLPLDILADGTLADRERLASRLGGFRAGAEWAPAGATLGAAAGAQSAGRVAPFALPFEPDSLGNDGGRTTGVEGYASLPLGSLPVRVTGGYLRWSDPGPRPYLPSEEGVAALVFRDRYYGGQLEPTLRLDLRYRGPSLAPGSDGELAAVDRYALLDFALEIRIIDVRAFVTFENVFNNQLAADLPGRFLPGARVLYGASWQFRN